MSGRAVLGAVLALTAAGGPLAAQAVSSPPESLAAKWREVEHLAQHHQWSRALDLAEALARDSAGRAVVARIAVNAGLEAYEAGDTARARERWALALHDDPALTSAAANLAGLLLQEGSAASARTIAERGLRHAPTDARLLAIRQQTLQSKAAIDSAIRVDRALRRRHPASDAAALDLAGLLLRSSQGLAAAALYDSLVHAPAPSEAVYVAATRFLFASGRYAGAARLADTAVSRHPRSALLWALAAHADSADSLWPAASTAYRRAAELTSEPSGLELRLIHAEAAAGDTATAVDVMRAMARRPAPRPALVAAAGLVTTLGAPRAADSVYRSVLAAAPQDVTALDASARIAERLGDTTRAVALYTREAAIDSGGPEAALGLLRLTRPPADSARQLLLLAEWRGLAQLQWAQTAAMALASSGNGPSALSAARPAAARAQQLATILRTVLDTIVFHTDWGPEELSKAETSYPNSPLLGLYAARLAERRGNDSLALVRYDALLRLKADDPGLQRARARVLEQLGRLADAASAYARAFDLAPTDDSSYRALVRLGEHRGTLDDLLAQVRRLRTRYPKLRVLTEHEIEILQRLGRLEEASAVAESLEDGHS